MQRSLKEWKKKKSKSLTLLLHDGKADFCLGTCNMENGINRKELFRGKTEMLGVTSIHLYSETPHAPTRFHTVILLLSQLCAEKYTRLSESLKAVSHCAGYSQTSLTWLIFRKDSHQHQIETFFSCAECLGIIHFPYPNILIPSPFFVNKQAQVFTKQHWPFSCVCVET